jgi:hypothetical protein
MNIHSSALALLDAAEWRAEQNGSLQMALIWFEEYEKLVEEMFPRSVDINVEFATGPHASLPVHFTRNSSDLDENWAEQWEEHYLGQLAIGGCNFHVELQRVRWYEPDGPGGQRIQTAGRDCHDRMGPIWKEADGCVETVQFDELPGEWVMWITPHGM